MPIGISESSAKDNRVAAQETARVLGSKARLVEGGGLLVGDKAALSLGETTNTQTVTAGGSVTLTDDGAVKSAVDLARDTNAGLLSLLGGREQRQPSVFDQLAGGTAVESQNAAAAAADKGKPIPVGVIYWALGIAAAAVLGWIITKFLNRKS